MSLRSRLMLGMLLGAAGCAEQNSGDLGYRGTDAGQGGSSGSGGAAGSSGTETVAKSKWAFFRVAEDGYALSLEDKSIEKVCEKGKPSPSKDGMTVLCIPSDSNAPLTMYSLEFHEELTSFESWIGSAAYPPLISPDGSQVAFIDFDSETSEEVLRVANDSGRVIDSKPAQKLIAYPADDTVVYDNFGGRILFSGLEPINIPTENYLAVGPDPVGAVFYKADGYYSSYFLDAEGGNIRYLGPGLTVQAYETRVLLLDSEMGSTGRLVDLTDENFEKSVTLPSLHFDELWRRVTFLDKSHIITESPTICDAVYPDCSRRTALIDLDQNQSRMLLESDQPHKILIDQKRRFMVTLETDSCGICNGNAKLEEFGGQGTPIDLKEAFKDRSIRGAGLSPDGNNLILVTTSGATLLDLRHSEISVEHLDVPSGLGEGPVLFR